MPLNHQWLATLQSSASAPPLRPRQPLYLNGLSIGSVEEDFLLPLTAGAHALPESFLLRQTVDGDSGWHIRGDATTSLATIAQALWQADCGAVRKQWRNEQLDVFADGETPLARIERGIARPLGVATHAVHLVGRTAQEKIWIQQRSLTKPNEPGLWDTLMGGMVASGESVDSTLTRETWEEAGLKLAHMQALRRRGKLFLHKPSTIKGDQGYVHERIDWFDCEVPQGMAPVNQDGEVAQFALVNCSELEDMLHADAFTTEAALILAAWLQTVPKDF
jgi:8-oxo-dGTP pyrophosphatase MutT (NUDIX family)